MAEAGYVDANRLAGLHEQCKEEALNWFDKQPKLGDETFIEKYRKRFVDCINEEFVVHEQRNIAERVCKLWLQK